MEVPFHMKTDMQLLLLVEDIFHMKTDMQLFLLRSRRHLPHENRCAILLRNKRCLPCENRYVALAVMECKTPSTWLGIFFLLGIFNYCHEVEGTPPPTGLQITCSKATVVKGEDPFHQGVDEVASVMYNCIPLHLCPVQSLSRNVAELVARGQREHPCNKTNQNQKCEHSMESSDLQLWLQNFFNPLE